MKISHNIPLTKMERNNIFWRYLSLQEKFNVYTLHHHIELNIVTVGNFPQACQWHWYIHPYHTQIIPSLIVLQPVPYMYTHAGVWRITRSRNLYRLTGPSCDHQAHHLLEHSVGWLKSFSRPVLAFTAFIASRCSKRDLKLDISHLIIHG